MNTVTRKKLVTAALAVCTTGASVLALATSPPLAHADKCEQWNFGQGNDFYQSNGWTMSFSGAPVNHPRTPSGTAIARPSRDPRPQMYGWVTDLGSSPHAPSSCLPTSRPEITAWRTAPASPLTQIITSLEKLVPLVGDP